MTVLSFKGALRGTKLDHGRTAERHVYIRRILHSSTVSVGLAQARPNYSRLARVLNVERFCTRTYLRMSFSASNVTVLVLRVCVCLFVVSATTCI